MSTWTVSDARASLPEIIDRVTEGEEIILTRHGKPVATILRPDLAAGRRAAGLFAAADALGARIDAARLKPRPKVEIPQGRVEEFIRELREDRDSR